MEINHSEYTIAELIEKLKTKDLIINKDYQRGGGIWPKSAQVYFIDTILEKYPFPKLYFYQIYDKVKRKPVMEIVDGQQRIMTIDEFINGNFKLSKASKNHKGKDFPSLDEDEQNVFRMYSVPVDVILAAERPQLLEMFRRMNAYTAPLNSAEKRHVRFQGKFKWFISELTDRVDPIIENFGILTTKQMIRMADAELLSELLIVLEKGIVNKNERNISKIYNEYNKEFSLEDKYENILLEFFSFVNEQLSEFKKTLLMRPYAIYSLFSVFAHNIQGIPNGEADLGFETSTERFLVDEQKSKLLNALIDAHETKDTQGDYREYVSAAISTTTKAAQRKARAKVLARILLS